METNAKERETVDHLQSKNSQIFRVSKARTELDVLERSYNSSSLTLQSMVLGLVFAVLVVMAYGLFGERIDREKFTTDVTPIHVELNPISGHRQTAQNPQNLQM